MRTSEFARATGLTVDTVRFYVRKGLLAPQTSAKGGRNPYRHFTEGDVLTARFVRFAQSAGLSLQEIAAINAERLGGGVSAARSIEIMEGQLRQLEERMTEYGSLAEYLRQKIAWTAGGGQGPAPRLQPRESN